MIQNLSTVLNAEFSLKEIPDSIPADIRPLWRILLCLMILNFSRAGTASLKKLQVLSWILTNCENFDLVMEALENDLAKKKLVVRYDPALDRALDFAIGEGLVEHTSSAKYKLTDKGRKIFKDFKETEIMAKEMRFVIENGSKFTEATVTNLLNW